MRPGRRRLWALASGAVVIIAGLVGPRIGGEPAPPPPAALVYLSGLDQHLLPAYETVPVHAEPGGPVVTSVPAGSLAWVHDQAGGWLEVVLAEGEPVRGWVGDYFSRGELHLVDPTAPSCPVPAGAAEFAPSSKVRLLDAGEPARPDLVRVRGVADGQTGWVPRAVLSEQPGPHPLRPGPQPLGPNQECAPWPLPEQTDHRHPPVSSEQP
ncbi:hypothetical protein JQS43_24735 [Natronosporangium hydrolyticum]|uniref:SH3 domain-containing protein n=1 Tax=Natronosporangium hydrolyticum TaxID=2811111 RepID=A0A895YB43_9ACTN|nr:hypothetical protein [Natronosporangium hydrolyticum]QSB14631.1 hypothetical protein JQS43_24735 [Natronosporangium hydrolyticum]